MIGTDSDVSWERYGREDPYFGVLSHERFRRADKPGPERTEFFATGEADVESMLALIETAVAPRFMPRRALDFGCGVGRILIPLARRIPEVVGLDVSPSMLAEARVNCEQAGLQNVTLLAGDDSLSALQGKFDFIHSRMVFQHIPESRGIRIAERLLSRLADDGVGALHFVYATARPAWREWAHRVRKSVPMAHPLVNLLRGRRMSAPLMQMNLYDSDRVLRLLQQHGCRQMSVQLTDHGGYFGALFFFRR